MVAVKRMFRAAFLYRASDGARGAGGASSASCSAPTHCACRVRATVCVGAMPYPPTMVNPARSCASTPARMALASGPSAAEERRVAAAAICLADDVVGGTSGVVHG